jgi:hypothetical protein
MVHLQKFHERYADDGLFVYAIAIHPNREAARRTTRELRLTYPIFWGTGSELAERYAYG